MRCSERVYKLVYDFVPQNNVEMLKFYSTWSDTYEADLSKLISGYNHPRQMAEVAALLLGESKAAKILDMCAGTGLVGQEVTVESQISSLHSFPSLINADKKTGIREHLRCGRIRKYATQGSREEHIQRLLY